MVLWPTLLILLGVIGLSSFATWWALDGRRTPSFYGAPVVLAAFHFVLVSVSGVAYESEVVTSYLASRLGASSMTTVGILFLISFYVPFAVIRWGSELLGIVAVTLVWLSRDDEDEIEKH